MINYCNSFISLLGLSLQELLDDLLLLNKEGADHTRRASVSMADLPVNVSRDDCLQRIVWTFQSQSFLKGNPIVITRARLKKERSGG